MAKQLMKGNEAIAEAAIRSGLKFYAGYPITPQNEIPEYLSRELPKAGGVFVPCETETAGVCMVYGASSTGARCMISSSGPGIALMQECISYLNVSRLPAVVVDVMRTGPGGGNLNGSQDDFNMVVRGGGNGHYHMITLAPSSCQEAVELMRPAFELADLYRNPVMFLCDGVIGQAMESVDFDKMPAPRTDLPSKESWSLRGRGYDGFGNKLPDGQLRDKRAVFSEEPGMDIYQTCTYREEVLYPEMLKEVRYEAIGIEDADVVLCAYGTTSRMAKDAIKTLAAQGIKAGIIRPITLWPFCDKVFEEIGANCKAIVVAEMNAAGQMLDFVKLAVNGRLPVHFVGNRNAMINANNIVVKVNEVLEAL